MSIAAAIPNGAGPSIATESLRLGLLWLMAFAGGFVFIEPSPYEVLGALTLLFFAITGMSLRAPLVPLLILLILLDLGYATSVMQVLDQTETLLWVCISVFLTATAVFFAAILSVNTEARLRSLMHGYVTASVVVSLIAVGAYFRVFGSASDLFIIYERARGTFKDPNVLGAFLILPGLIMIRCMLVGRRSQAIGAALLLLPIIGGLFLSFSRAAWGQFVLCGLLVAWLTFVTSRSSSRRLRIALVIALAGLAAALLVIALLSNHHVDQIFAERAELTQSYDSGHTGRFGRYWIGLQILLERPLGLGPLQFLFPEAPHDVYLNAFITGGWISGIAYLTLTLVTLVAGARFVFVGTPWQSTYQIIYVTYLGVVGESLIIDSDHWRHYFLVLGVLWGLMAASRPYLAAVRAAVPAPSSCAAV